MGSSSLPMSQQMYFSTHNALRINEENDVISTLFYEINGNRHISLLIFPFYDVQMLKRLLIKKLNLPGGIKVNDIIIFYKGIKLPNYRIISTYLDNNNRNEKKKRKTVNKLYWAIKDTNPNASIRVIDNKSYPPFFENILNEIKLAFKKNISPKLTMDGTGGTYLLFNGKKKVCSVFKPLDEEAFAPFNPRGYEGKMYQEGFRSGVLSGEGASREIAAYILDNNYNNFSNVPCTIMVEACHPHFNNRSKLKYIDNESNLKWKCGSLQEFIDSKESVGNYDYKQFSIRDIHKIAILDIRVMNLDRNDGNILVSPLKSLKDSYNQFLYRNNQFFSTNNEDILKRIVTIDKKPSRYSLIPIDHGLILPHIMDVAEIDLVWFEWPQTKVPFDDEELHVIFTFDPDKDAEKIRKKLLIREDCIRTMRVCTRLLQIGARMHLNLYEIAKISTRKNIDDESILEHLVKDSIIQAYQMMDYTSLMSTNRLGHILDLAEIKINKKKKNNNIKSKTVDNIDDKIKKSEDINEINKNKGFQEFSNTKKNEYGSLEDKKVNYTTSVSFKEIKESISIKEHPFSNNHYQKEDSKINNANNSINSNINIFSDNVNICNKNVSSITNCKEILKKNENTKDNKTCEQLYSSINQIIEECKYNDKNKIEDKKLYNIQNNEISEYNAFYKNKKSVKMINETNNNSSPITSFSSTSEYVNATTSSTSNSYDSSLNNEDKCNNSKKYDSHNEELNDNSNLPNYKSTFLNGPLNKSKIKKKKKREKKKKHKDENEKKKEIKEEEEEKEKEKKERNNEEHEDDDDEDEDEEEEEEEEENDDDDDDETFKKPSGTIKRISENTGTAYRNMEMNKINSIWMIRDKNNKIINVKWENKIFEKLFFETFENYVKKYINDYHPNWKNYPYNGNKITSIKHSYLNSIK
ncbi:phosphatidylinositol 3-and 4-kinase, putative [Plasmodium gallinaceum]|uniref:Phosphatidylinositol 3-and 4-kinase, putative n=1 Tax=Plasmodium gallinaceum TaxID=5849 RepID=A0A1J1GS70_PLAGA|nr:phosphatidylinositol 3-and 4-kinase, putative [Plasmodium gallinaceum]CRG95339.1 phosphatidylinositol 3-and 4-kinase, putative [Plasmodium gallinaceum]